MSNGKSGEEDNIKSAADLLLKGGTLLGNSCENCGGVQVRFKENIICISCGRKVKEVNGTQIEEEATKKKIVNNNSDLSNEMQSKPKSNYSNSNIQLTTFKNIIYKKITLLLTSLENDSDILTQNTKLDLIAKYLDIADKLKIIDKEN